MEALLLRVDPAPGEGAVARGHVGQDGCMCVGLLMYSVASVCEVYTDDINMGVGLNVCVLIGFVVLVRQDPW